MSAVIATKSAGKRPFWRLKCRCKNGIKLNHKVGNDVFWLRADSNSRLLQTEL
jgi:hypothetical protein